METLPCGQQGEVCVRGYALMKGYDGDPEGTAQVIQPDGWLRTGDLGVMREDGCIHITGRSRDVIIRGGENIYPREVEEFLYTHPKVGEVQVIGIPNERLGEIVVAWIRLRPGVEATEEEITEFLQGPDRLLQDSRARPLRHRVSGHALGQDSEVQDARVRDRGARLAGCGKGGDGVIHKSSAPPDANSCASELSRAASAAASRETAMTVISSCWPNALASSTMDAIGSMEIWRLRSKPKSSPFAFCASTMPSE